MGGRGFGGRGGPGGFGPPRFGGVDLDPLVGLDGDGRRTPLRNKLLAVPALRARYLGYIRAIAEKDLDWTPLGRTVARFRSLIVDEVKADTRKLSTLAAFQAATSQEVRDEADEDPERGRGPGGGMSLRDFAVARRNYLLSLPAIRAAKAP